jgi:hypothetical protein
VFLVSNPEALARAKRLCKRARLTSWALKSQNIMNRLAGFGALYKILERRGAINASSIGYCSARKMKRLDISLALGNLQQPVYGAELLDSLIF